MTVSHVRESTPPSIMHHWIHPSSKENVLHCQSRFANIHNKIEDLRTAEIAETVHLVQGGPPMLLSPLFPLAPLKCPKIMQ